MKDYLQKTKEFLLQEPFLNFLFVVFLFAGVSMIGIQLGKSSALEASTAVVSSDQSSGDISLLPEWNVEGAKSELLLESVRSQNLPVIGQAANIIQGVSDEIISANDIIEKKITIPNPDDLLQISFDLADDLPLPDFIYIKKKRNANTYLFIAEPGEMDVGKFHIRIRVNDGVTTVASLFTLTVLEYLPPQINITSHENGNIVLGKKTNIFGNGIGTPARVTVNGEEAQILSYITNDIRQTDAVNNKIQDVEKLSSDVVSKFLPNSLELKDSETYSARSKTQTISTPRYGFFVKNVPLKMKRTGKAKIAARAFNAKGKLLAENEIFVTID